jgi:hypothetical protein
MLQSLHSHGGSTQKLLALVPSSAERDLSLSEEEGIDGPPLI